MPQTEIQVDDLLHRLNASLPSAPWRDILEGFAITGALDIDHLNRLSGLNGMPLRRLLHKMDTQRASLAPLFSRHPRDLSRKSKPGRPAPVYLLSLTGAALLRELGHPDARPCGLNDDTALTHALGMVDVHLTARSAGVAILTDQTLPYGDEQELRPDHQVRLPGRKTLLFEVEQAASLATLRRVQASLERKRAFFASQASAGVERSVQILLQVGRSAQAKTIQTWQRAIRLNCEAARQPLNFRLRLMPLADFLSQPDWELAQPEPASPEHPHPEAPPELLRRTAREDRLVLSALWQEFHERSVQRRDDDLLPDPEFLRSMALVYTASHDPQLPTLVQAALPQASLYLLNEYLTMRGLREPLRKAIQNGRTHIRWNPTTILHRMQTVVDAFLAWHGWRSSGPLSARVMLGRWDSNDPPFYIYVSLRDLLPEDECAWAEEALAWALLSLFAHAPELGLGRPEFW